MGSKAAVMVLALSLLVSVVLAQPLLEEGECYPGTSQVREADCCEARFGGDSGSRHTDYDSLHSL